jgi:methyltransferase
MAGKEKSSKVSPQPRHADKILELIAAKKRKHAEVEVYHERQNGHSRDSVETMRDVEAQLQKEASASQLPNLTTRSHGKGRNSSAQQEMDVDSPQEEPPAKLKQTKTKPSTKSQSNSKTAGNEIGFEHNSERKGEFSGLNTSKPSAIFKPNKEGRDWTLSIALPGSIIKNAQKLIPKTILAGRIARAAAIFAVDEIVVFDDAPTEIPPNLRAKVPKRYRQQRSKAELLTDVRPEDERDDNPDQFLYHLIYYLETPPYLRKHLIPVHPNLDHAALLPSMDMPHHMRSHEWCQYREGAAIETDPKDDYTLVEAGLSFPVKIYHQISPGDRVTLRFASPSAPPSWPDLSEEQVDALGAECVATSTPREEGGYHWGYYSRKAESLSDVYENCPYSEEGGYDYTIGTSERGVELSSVLPDRRKEKVEYGKFPKSFKHLLLVFGGVAGLEQAVVGDPKIQKLSKLTKETASQAFDAWVNLVPNQASRTIRTEEAVLLGLMAMSEYVRGNGKE